ncbi:MAG: chorismate-binding protein, partial [Cyanobacteriota bacterium]|nr:chorismate-binding protein [Cyanobacteriota bacterium]
FDSNIIIRSLLLKDRTLRAHAGCGIVADSDPQGEADEMGWKIEPLLTALA